MCFWPFLTKLRPFFRLPFWGEFLRSHNKSKKMLLEGAQGIQNGSGRLKLWLYIKSTTPNPTVPSIFRCDYFFWLKNDLKMTWHTIKWNANPALPTLTPILSHKKYSQWKMDGTVGFSVVDLIYGQRFSRPSPFWIPCAPSRNIFLPYYGRAEIRPKMAIEKRAVTWSKMVKNTSNRTLLESWTTGNPNLSSKIKLVFYQKSRIFSRAVNLRTVWDIKILKTD